MARHSNIAAILIQVGLIFAGVSRLCAEDDPTAARTVETVVATFCVDCHNSEQRAGDLDLQRARFSGVTEDAELWEKVVRKLRTRQMPPPKSPRPDEATYLRMLAVLEPTLDRLAEANPNPGETESLRRLTRVEYQNAIRDLLALDLDLQDALPADESSHGFDQATASSLSPAMLEKYLSVARRVSELAIGASVQTPRGDTFRIPADLTQEEHVAGLPLGTRGGALIPYVFPANGEYEIQIRLARDRNEEVEGLRESHQLIVLVDREEIQQFTIGPPEGHKNFEQVDAGLRLRGKFSAGPHQLGMTFLKKPSSLLEIKRQPYQAHFNMHRHPRISPAIYQISITGPYSAAGPANTPSRRRIFGDKPVTDRSESAARSVLGPLLQRAYRRRVVEDDFKEPLRFFAETADKAGFEAGIESALTAILVNPHFLLRIESAPARAASGAAYRLNDVELASRLSFFLWSSIPDDELLEVAIGEELNRPEILAAQVTRMLRDPRSKTMATNFADQWLQVRNLESMTPDARLFPDFDENLRRSMRRQTHLQFDAVQRQDRSVLELLASKTTYLDERLAKHYGIPHVYGSRFRAVELDEQNSRGGALRQASVLTVTSYPTRTSPVLRGKWVLENLLGTPPPPPPANVPALPDNVVAANLAVRERLAAHRANPACASCHDVIDPIGFALDNFDALGRWRFSEEGKPLDVLGGLPDGSSCQGVAGLEESLIHGPEIFIATLAEKLLCYALGRGLEYYDAAAVRKIVRATRANDDRFSALILAIVKSTPFQMRKAP